MVTLTTCGVDADLAVERAAAAFAERVARRQADRARRLGSCVVCRGMGRGYVPAAGRLPAGGRCADHLPAQPTSGYCAPARCYCGGCVASQDVDDAARSTTPATADAGAVAGHK